MIVDFLTEQLRRRSLRGQPLILESMIEGHLRCARSFEQLDPVEQQACIAAPDKTRELLASLPNHHRILFVRPIASLHVQAALGVFQPVQVDHNSSLPPRIEQEVLRVPDLYWRYLLGKVFETEKESSQAWMQVLIDHLTSFIRAVSPKLTLFITDAQFLERLISLICKQLDIPTATIQHGIFSGKFDPSIQEGEASDYFLVWSEFTKRLLTKSGNLAHDRIFVCGYPYPVTPLPALATNEPGSKAVVFLGQPFESYRLEQARAKAEIASRVFAVCEKHGLDFKYRPHPAESLSSLGSLIPPEKVISPQIRLQEVFRENAAFVSLTSSALIEAGLFGRAAIQIYDELFEFENLDEVGACYACEQTEPRIEALLRRHAEGNLPPRPVSEDYLPVFPNLSAVLLQIYQSIMKESSSRPSRPSVNGQTTVIYSGVPSADAHPGSAPLRRPIDALSFLRSERVKDSIPADLDVDRLCMAVAGWQRQPDNRAVISSPFAALTLDEIRKTCEVSRYIIRISPPHAEGAISWLKNLHTAFVRATDVSTFVEFEGDLRPGIDSEPSLARAELIFEYLRAQLDETQPLTKEVALALGTLLAGGLRTSIAEKMLDVRDPAQAQTLVLREATAKHLLTVRDELLPYQIRLNQIRASGLWKLRTKILKLLGNSQA